MGLQSKMVVYAAIAAMLALMGGIVFYASLENPELEKVEIILQNVKLVEVDKIENKAKLEVVFLVKNPSEKTFTVPLIDYKLYADGQLLGSGQYSTQDIAMPGRAAFYAGVEIPLKSKFVLVKNSENSEIYQSIIDGKNVNFSANGIITVETSWSLIEKEFST